MSDKVIDFGAIAPDAMGADGAFGADVTANSLFIDATPGGEEAQEPTVAEICAQLDKRVGFADISTLRSLIETHPTARKDVRALLALVRKVLKGAPAEAKLEGAEREAHLLRALAEHVVYREREDALFLKALDLRAQPAALDDPKFAALFSEAEKAEFLAACEEATQEGYTSPRERYDALDPAGKAEFMANLRGARVIPDDEWKQLVADGIDYQHRIFVYLTSAATALEAQLRRSH